LITSILTFWFAGDQQYNYKHKWFPEGILQVEADTYIFSNYSKYLAYALDGRLSHWKQQSIDSAIALIILCDQFSRHIFRYQQVPSDSPDRQQADKIALDTADYLRTFPEATNLPMSRFIFSLMPLRHSATTERLNNVMQHLSDKEKAEGSAHELLNRFRKQTIRRLQHLQDREKVLFIIREGTDCIFFSCCLFFFFPFL
jgi:uncharacterized protein (DUF924 family)